MGTTVFEAQMDSVDAIVVAVPARCEMAWIARSLASLSAAADRLPGHVAVRMVIASDSCADGTSDVVHHLARIDPRITLLEGSWGTAAGARHAAIEAGLAWALADGYTLERTWIATTDADTVVPTCWLLGQLELAATSDAVAGVIELYPDSDLTEAVVELFSKSGRAGAGAHGQVHATNLGVRASAYEAVGGFPATSVLDDRAIWNALRDAEFRCTSSLGVWVLTSARRVGRRPGGLASIIDARLSAAYDTPARLGASA